MKRIREVFRGWRRKDSARPLVPIPFLPESVRRNNGVTALRTAKTENRPNLCKCLHFPRLGTGRHCSPDSRGCHLVKLVEQICLYKYDMMYRMHSKTGRFCKFDAPGPPKSGPTFRATCAGCTTRTSATRPDHIFMVVSPSLHQGLQSTVVSSEGF
jgi:hypothetical protein